MTKVTSVIGVGTFSTSDKMRAYVNAVLDSGRLSYGEFSQRLEHRFAQLHNCEFAVLSNSGTSSLQVAIQALKEMRGWKDGDEIIVPAITFVASVNVILHNNMTPVLVDVERDYYGINPSRIEQAITPRTRAIMPVHVFGQPCNMVMINNIAKRHNLAIIEDSCECVGVSHFGISVGAWGDVACFSTYVAHILTTGIGGIATTNIDDLAIKMRSLVNHGRDGIYISPDDNKTGAAQREVIAKRFSFTSIGHSYRITELEAALGLAQIDDLPQIIRMRQANASYLTEKLSSLADVIQLPTVRPDTEHAWMMYPIVLLDRDRDQLTEFLESRGIETRQMLPLTNQPCYAGMWDERDYPIADWINHSGFYVASHQDLTHDDLNHIAETLIEYFT